MWASMRASMKDAKEACYDSSEAQGNNRPAENVRKVRARVRAVSCHLSPRTI